ncbi:MAG: hypothetical protein SFY69_11185 [Planctomycetota bacterium]|nr:hypothetical protein [Planctomycetota bacterium]
MGKAVVIGMGVVAVGLFAGVGVLAFVKSKDKFAEALKPAPPPPPVEPPADARILEDDVEPGMVVGSIVGVRREADRRAIEASYVGTWTPNRGWEGEVVDVTDERSGVALRLFYAQGGMLSSGFYVIAVVPANDQGVQKGDVATVQGRISKLEMLETQPLPTFRVVLDPARVLRNRTRSR